jgi:hypothetical protein
MMINNQGRRIKRADKGKAPESQGNQFLSAKGVDLVERFYLQCEKIFEWEERGPTPGTIWNSHPEREEDLFGPMLLILKAVDADLGPALLVAEVSECIEQAMETDLVIGTGESSLPFNFMIRSMNIFWTNSNRLKDCIGEIDESKWSDVLKFVFSSNFDEHISPLDYQFVETQDTVLMRRDGTTSGLPVTEEEDPRLNFSQESIRKCEYLAHDVSVAGMESRLDPAQVYGRLRIGNKSFPLESLETRSDILKIKGRLVLQDIIKGIYNEKMKEENRYLRIEIEDVPLIEVPLAALEDLRDRYARGIAIDLSKQFLPDSSLELEDIYKETEAKEAGLRLKPVLACVAKNTEVKILCDDSSTAIFLQLTRVKKETKSWSIGRRSEMASSIPKPAPLKCLSPDPVGKTGSECLLEDSGSPKDFSFLHTQPSIVLGIYSILRIHGSSPAIEDRIHKRAHYLLLPQVSPRRLLRIGSNLSNDGEIRREIDSNKEFLQEIPSFLSVIRNPTTTIQNRCDSIAELARILGDSPYWGQLENILHSTPFDCPLVEATADFGDLVVKASVILDFHTAKGMTADVESVLDPNILLPHKSANEYLTQVIFGRFLRSRFLKSCGPVGRGLDGEIGKLSSGKQCVKYPSYEFEVPDNFWEEIEKLYSEKVFSNTPTFKVQYIGYLDCPWNKLKEHADERLVGSVIYEDTCLLGTVFFLQKGRDYGVIRSTDGEEFYFRDSDLRGGLKLKDELNGMQVCFQVKSENAGSQTKHAINISRHDHCFLKGLVYAVRDRYGFICASNGRDYYFDELDLLGHWKLEDVVQGAKVYFQVRKESHNPTITGAARNVTSSNLLSGRSYI